MGEGRNGGLPGINLNTKFSHANLRFFLPLQHIKNRVIPNPDTWKSEVKPIRITCPDEGSPGGAITAGIE
jgi:hypothetical protein